jgi:hypothetical protein
MSNSGIGRWCVYSLLFSHYTVATYACLCTDPVCLPFPYPPQHLDPVPGSVFLKLKRLLLETSYCKVDCKFLSSFAVQKTVLICSWLPTDSLTHILHATCHGVLLYLKMEAVCTSKTLGSVLSTQCYNQKAAFLIVTAVIISNPAKYHTTLHAMKIQIVCTGVEDLFC